MTGSKDSRRVGSKSRSRVAVGIVASVGIALTIGLGAAPAFANGTRDETCISAAPLPYEYAHATSTTTNAKTVQLGALGASACGSSSVRGQYRPYASAPLRYTAWVYSSGGTAVSPTTGYTNEGGQHSVSNPGGIQASYFPLNT